MSRLNIRSWLEPFPDREGVAVVFDVFRCSTTVHALMNRNLGPVYVAPSLKEVLKEARLKEMRLFSELSQAVDCLERFDNSPHDAHTKPWSKEHPALVATTTGTPAMFAARDFAKVYVGSLVNFSALVDHLSRLDAPITLIPAAFPEAKHVEDEITAQAMATALEGFANLPEFVHQCAAQAKEKIIASGRPAHLTEKIPTGGHDVAYAMEIDRFERVISLDFTATGSPLFALARFEK